MRLRPLVLASLSTAIFAACGSAPSRSEALRALRDAAPSFDAAPVYVRVWQDGPPWFSCAEVLAKVGTARDAPAVRDEIGNWRPLVQAGWLVLRDSSYRVVSDPGWCVAKLSDEAAPAAKEWVPFAADSFATGSARRGWTVPVGRRRLVITAPPKAAGDDSVVVRYAAVVQPNANGAAMNAGRDSAHATALLRKIDGAWRVVELTRPD